MDTSKRQSGLYSFFKGVITSVAFAALFYLLIVCFIATYRLISDIGSVRVLFLNPILILLAAMAGVFALGICIFKSPKAMNAFMKLEDKDSFGRVMLILKALIFIECLVFIVGANGMKQSVDQLSVQQAAYGYSWGETETFTPPGYMGIYPNNLGMSVVLYLTSLVAGHYNNLFIMLVYSLLVPFIYSDLASIGGRFGLSKKAQIMVMAAGLFFLPLQAKTLIIYGDVPGLFFAVRAMKHASEIASKKVSLKNILTVIFFAASACIFKNNFIIFAIAITIYLTAELLRQRRYKELYIPAAVIAASVLLNTCLTLTVGAVIGQAVSSGASKWSWIAMGMQEEAGMYNGYNASTYAEAGFDASVQSGMAKSSIAESLRTFAEEPNYAIGFYTRKILIQWSDATHCAFEFHSRNVYAADNSSPLMWFLASPRVISAASSCLKVFQLLMFTGSAVFAVKEGRRKTGSPASLLLLTFAGGYVFHLIWEAAPFYTLAYMTILIPTGVAGMIALIKKLSAVKLKELNNVRVRVDSGVVYFIVGVLVFFFAAAGMGTVKNLLIEGRKEYKAYYGEVLDQSRNPIREGIYYLRPAAEGSVSDGIKVELIRYAGKYRMRFIIDGNEAGDDIFLVNDGGSLNVNWFSYDDDQVFTIVRNFDGTYTIFSGATDALMQNAAAGSYMFADFCDYTFMFNTEEYNEYISMNPVFAWNLVPVS